MIYDFSHISFVYARFAQFVRYGFNLSYGGTLNRHAFTHSVVWRYAEPPCIHSLGRMAVLWTARHSLTQSCGGTLNRHAFTHSVVWRYSEPLRIHAFTHSVVWRYSKPPCIHSLSPMAILWSATYSLTRSYGGTLNRHAFTHSVLWRYSEPPCIHSLSRMAVLWSATYLLSPMAVLWTAMHSITHFSFTNLLNALSHSLTRPQPIWSCDDGGFLQTSFFLVNFFSFTIHSLYNSSTCNLFRLVR